MNEYETKSCIRFVPRTDQPDYVYIEKTVAGYNKKQFISIPILKINFLNVFHPHYSCYSYIGRIGVGQTVSLDSSCFNGGLPGTVIHELLHAVGFFHEQSRTDRDDYIVINYSNVQPGEQKFYF